RCAHLRFDPGPVVLGTEQLRPRPFGLDLDSVRFPAGRTHGAPPVSGGVQQPLLPETRGSVRFYTEEGTLPVSVNCAQYMNDADHGQRAVRSSEGKLHRGPHGSSGAVRGKPGRADLPG